MPHFALALKITLSQFFLQGSSAFQIQSQALTSVLSYLTVADKMKVVGFFVFLHVIKDPLNIK